jgi:lysophospholipase L1-like esterase
MNQLLRSLVISLGLIVALELIVRVVAAVGLITLVSGDIHGFDRLHRGDDVPLDERLYESDRDLIFRMRADYRTIYPRASLFPGQPVSYSVETNDRGFRTKVFSDAKPPGIFRVVCLGDSSTFGMNVEAADAYPQVLAELLEARMPGRFQVLNLGVPGYTSRQGLELIRRQVSNFEPDLVTFGYGSNGRFWPGATTDDANIRFNQTRFGGIAIAAKQGLDQIYTYRLVRKLVSIALYKLVEGGASAPDVPHRVTLEGMSDSISAAHAEIGRAGATLIVVNMDIARTDALQGMKMGVDATGAMYLDMRELFDQTQRERTRRIETELGLPAASAKERRSLLRVRAADSSEVSLEWRTFLSASAVKRMRDDGLRGDQAAGDGIWSTYIPQRAGNKVLYLYLQTEAGEKTPEFEPGSSLGGRWRMERIPESGLMDIDDFGHYFLHTDNAHPDEEGHRLIAQALVPAVLGVEAASRE